MKNNQNELAKSLKSVFAATVIPVALIVAVCVFKYIMGAPANFQGGNPENLPLPGNYLGTIYKGGFIVPILMTFLLTVITFSFERFFTLTRAAGKGSVTKFVQSVKKLLDQHKIDEAVALCDKQKGSVANVIKSGLERYKGVEGEDLLKDQKILAIQKEVEEATSLELPSLEANLVILSTLASVSTLMGLLGTVMGMIRAFSAMAQAGAPDSVALSVGISEALINTAFGIGTSALAIIMYNIFTTKIDKLTFSIDEAGFSIAQTYAANHK
ncbi:MAG: MotA/TolQ/ExbB proton channel family protein [Bacteroidota bacterium]|nr:MotA/TolQ/ExbB proton channel family protein [Bacteroidota bacterium]